MARIRIYIVNSNIKLFNIKNIYAKVRDVIRSSRKEKGVSIVLRHTIILSHTPNCTYPYILFKETSKNSIAIVKRD